MESNSWSAKWWNSQKLSSAPAEANPKRRVSLPRSLTVCSCTKFLLNNEILITALIHSTGYTVLSASQVMWVASKRGTILKGLMSFSRQSSCVCSAGEVGQLLRAKSKEHQEMCDAQLGRCGETGEDSINVFWPRVSILMDSLAWNEKDTMWASRPLRLFSSWHLHIPV